MRTIETGINEGYDLSQYNLGESSLLVEQSTAVERKSLLFDLSKESFSGRIQFVEGFIRDQILRR